MPIETLEDIAEEMADKFGIYGSGPAEGKHPDECKCRICFCTWLRGRMYRAAAIEIGVMDSKVDDKGERNTPYHS